MNSARFDRVTRAFEAKRSRRRVLAMGAAGAAAAGLARATPAAVQDATPEAITEHPTFLFVQLADRGTWTPKPDEDGVYLLTLSGTGEQTLYFSDRPERIVGTVETDRFLDALGFTPVEPPNAAIVVTTPEGERDVLVVELFNPVYTRTFGETGEEFLTYEAMVLNAYQGEALEEWVPQADDDQLPAEFTNVSLFIDDCADAEGCYVWQYSTAKRGQMAPAELAYVGAIPGGPYGRCYNWGQAICLPCEHENYELANLCNDAYPDACAGERSIDGYCTVNTCQLGGIC
jgi:hypothetical protein